MGKKRTKADEDNRWPTMGKTLQRRMEGIVRDVPRMRRVKWAFMPASPEVKASADRDILDVRHAFEIVPEEYRDALYKWIADGTWPEEKCPCSLGTRTKWKVKMLNELAKIRNAK